MRKNNTNHFNIVINARARFNFVMSVLVVLVFHLDDLGQDVEGVVVVVVDTGSDEKTLKETSIFLYLSIMNAMSIDPGKSRFQGRKKISNRNRIQVIELFRNKSTIYGRWVFVDVRFS
jgi:hypothetical protein